MENIPTAKQFMSNIGVTTSPISGLETYLKADFENALIKFAKLHCEAQAKAILEHTRPLLLTNKHGSSTTGKYAGLTNTITLNKEQLKNAYPLENIK